MRIQNMTVTKCKTMIPLLFLFIWMTNVNCQTFTVSFKAMDKDQLPVRLDKVIIENLSKQCVYSIMAPDTMVQITNGTGVDDMNAQTGFRLSVVAPNPFSGITQVRLQGVKAGVLMSEIANMQGQIVTSRTFECSQDGSCVLNISLANKGMYALTVSQKDGVRSAKLLNTGNGGENLISLDGFYTEQNTYKYDDKMSRATIIKPADQYDHMRYVGYATYNGVEIESAPATYVLVPSKKVTLNFDVTHTGLPCFGMPMVTDVDGNLYNTVQVGTQCWLKENLRTTHYANGESIPMTTGGYGYCYRYLPNGDSANLQTYGYLYDWNATTHSFSGSNPNQGACPTGWHVPTIGELNALFSFVKNTSWLWCDSNSMCDAAALADSVGWDDSPYQCAPGYAGGSNNMSGFSARPAGMYNGVGSNTYASLGRTAFFWSSTLVPPQTPVYPSNEVYYRRLDNSAGVGTPVGGSGKTNAMSVRCLRD